MKIDFNEQQLNVLNTALVELPYRLAAPLIKHINEQIQTELKDIKEQAQLKQKMAEGE